MIKSQVFAQPLLGGYRYSFPLGNLVPPPVKIVCPAPYLLVGMHHVGSPHSLKVQIIVSQLRGRKDQDVPLLQLQDETGFVQDQLATLAVPKGYHDAQKVIVGVRMRLRADLDVEHEARKWEGGRTLVHWQHLAKYAEVRVFFWKMLQEDCAYDIVNGVHGGHYVMVILGILFHEL